MFYRLKLYVKINQARNKIQPLNQVIKRQKCLTIFCKKKLILLHFWPDIYHTYLRTPQGKGLSNQKIRFKIGPSV